jgi:PqqD family protein of HPr-rel-A system
MVPKDWRLEWREWGGLHIVYNPASGNTHLLNSVSALVLSSLERGASTIEDLELLVSSSGAHRATSKRSSSSSMSWGS